MNELKKELKRYNLGEEAAGIVYANGDSKIYELWEVPLYGGEEVFNGFYNSLDDIEKVVKSWT